MIISILHLKGGAGKTTIATNLAAELSKSAAVLLVDTDHQGSSSRWAGQRQSPDPNLTVVSLLDSAALQKALPQLARNYTYIVIDGAPQLDTLNAACIAASDSILIPSQPSPYDLWATVEMVRRIKTAQMINPRISAFFVLNRFSSTTKMGREMAEALAELDLPLLSARIFARVAYADAAIQGRSVAEGDYPKARNEFAELVRELKEKVIIYE